MKSETRNPKPEAGPKPKGRARTFGVFGGFVAVLGLILAGCTVGPDYHRPSTLKSQPIPGSFAESPTNGSGAALWKPAAPAAHQPRGPWWEMFADEELNRLEAMAGADNQDLTAAVARFEQARALVKVARSSLFPQVNLSPSVIRQRTSANAPQLGQPAGTASTFDTFAVPVDASWELDFWGRVRRQTEGARARFQATADDLESFRLSLQAEVASDYLTLRALASERALLTDTIQTYRRSLELTQNRRKGGIATDLDVSEAETQLRTAEAQVPAIDLQRANLEHALAVLCGQPPSNFRTVLAPSPGGTVPALPGGLPSELLERRPDIAAAERRVAAANADIGVATSAFYPRVVINGLAGFQSLDAGTLFDWPSRVWAVGPSVQLPLFTGGRNRAQLAFSRRAYDETVANYRQVVLNSFQEVEDQLAAERLLATESAAQNAALASARHTLEIANNRYKAGLVTYLEVATAQSEALNQERAVVLLEGHRQVALVGLIKALGGTWPAT